MQLARAGIYERATFECNENETLTRLRKLILSERADIRVQTRVLTVTKVKIKYGFGS